VYLSLVSANKKGTINLVPSPGERLIHKLNCSPGFPVVIHVRASYRENTECVYFLLSVYQIFCIFPGAV
jgi:hypothetical protein